MQMIDNFEDDDKIIAIASNDPSVNHYTSVEDLPPHFITQLKNYFEQYKVLENKVVKIDAFQNKEEAYAIIEESIDLYQKTFSSSI
jgi:inorganic pyrophosphatase